MTRVVRSGYHLTFISLALLCIFLFPIYWMVLTSLKTTPQIFTYPPVFIPENLDFDMWINGILPDPNVWRYIRNSTIIATGTMVLTVLLAAPAAYAVAHLPIRGKSAIMIVSLSTLMFPAIMTAMPLFVIFSRLGLTNTYLGLILADTTLALPFAIVLLRPFFASIPKDLVEAARIDGCSQFGAFLRIIVPVARPGLMTAAIFAFLFGWGDLVFALALGDNNAVRPVTAGLWAYIGSFTNNWGGAMAFSTLAMAPPLVVFLITQRYVVAGLLAGGLKE